jgi:ABC-type uncharacterized transport system ATPase component
VCNRNSIHLKLKLWSSAQEQEARDWLRSEAAHRERLNIARRDIFQSASMQLNANERLEFSLRYLSGGQRKILELLEVFSGEHLEP